MLKIGKPQRASTSLRQNIAMSAVLAEMTLEWRTLFG
jgi:hypothetical protein